MDKYFIMNLGDNERNGYVIGARLSKSNSAYSPFLDIGFNRKSTAWEDAMPHLHTDSEEYFVVLKGSLDMLVNGESVKIYPNNLIGIRANTPHQIIGGMPPIENFLIRVPGNMADKVTAESFEAFQEKSIASSNQTIQMDLKKSHNDYLIGACLPAAHPNYSPLLDFTSAWRVDPKVEWQNETLHYHIYREEYYFILEGYLDFEIDGSLVSVSAGQILGVRPSTVHKVIGGKMLVDVLFVRVPGGHDDKIMV